MEQSPFTGETMADEGKKGVKIILERIQTDIEGPIESGKIIPAARFEFLLDLYTDPKQNLTPEQTAELKKQLTLLAEAVVEKKLYEKNEEASWKSYLQELQTS